jgi:hypothetical protein
VDPLKAADPTELSGFALRGRLGRGGMGTVYYGITPDGEQVAVKMIREDLLDRSEVLGRFDREAIAIEMVQGPRVANLVASSGSEESPPWFAVESVRGLTLAEYVTWLGITEEQLEAIYPARYPVLGDYEDATWFDATGGKIAGNWSTYGTGQTKEHWEQFQAYLEDPEQNPVPDGYTAPFYKADRIAEYRQAHAAFSARVAAATTLQEPSQRSEGDQ